MFNGENYHMWSIKMKTYLEAQGLWEAVLHGRGLTPLRQNPTIAQKVYEEEKAKKPKALSCIFLAVTEHLFTRIMTCDSPKETSDKMKDELKEIKG